MPENDNPIQELQELVDTNLNDDNNNESKPVELTDEEKRKLFIEQLKESKRKFKRIKHPEKNGEKITNLTINKYGTKFKKERKNKNKQAKKSRRANRK